MTVYLELRTGAGGTPEENITDALGVAARLGVWVEIVINGVRVLIHPEDRLETLATNWRKALDRGADFCSANVIPSGPFPSEPNPPQPIQEKGR